MDSTPAGGSSAAKVLGEEAETCADTGSISACFHLIEDRICGMELP